MNIECFTERTETLHKRVADLYQTANVLHLMPPEMLPLAFKELRNASKLLHLVTEELYLQNEEIVNKRRLAEIECQRYQNLFELAPDGYLVTDAEGKIREANLAAATLFNIPQHSLVEKQMVIFVPIEETSALSQFSDTAIAMRQNKRISNTLAATQWRVI